jgi:hypothetical protein
VGSIAWWTDDAGTYTGSAGHVAYVERVNADGSIVVSEDNWGGTFHWKTHTAGYAWPNGFIHLKDVGGGAGVSEGQFVSFDDHVYRIADGAPVYVSSWNYFGGPQATTALSASRFAALRQYPLDGTFVSDQDGSVYRFAGGAPIYVSNFDHVGGTGGQPVTRVDKVALERTEPTGTWSHVSHRPADGTVLDAGGTKYVTAAGAPAQHDDRRRNPDRFGRHHQRGQARRVGAPGRPYPCSSPSAGAQLAHPSHCPGTHGPCVGTLGELIDHGDQGRGEGRQAAGEDRPGVSGCEPSLRRPDTQERHVAQGREVQHPRRPRRPGAQPRSRGSIASCFPHKAVCRPPSVTVRLRR